MRRTSINAVRRWLDALLTHCSSPPATFREYTFYPAVDLGKLVWLATRNWWFLLSAELRQASIFVHIWILCRQTRRMRWWFIIYCPISCGDRYNLSLMEILFLLSLGKYLHYAHEEWMIIISNILIENWWGENLFIYYVYALCKWWNIDIVSSFLFYNCYANITRTQYSTVNKNILL